MKITILGTGAMACLFGARLADRGDVALLGTWREGIDAVNRNGVRVETPDGEATVSVKATGDPAICAGTDLLIVLVKANRTAESAARASAILRPEGLALTLQNGLGNVEILREIFGPDRAAGGSAVVGAFLAEPGVVRTRGDGTVWVEKHPRSLPALELFEAGGFETHLAVDLDSVLWAKLVANTAINPLSALLRIPNGELVEREQVRQTLEAVATETAGIAKTLGITLPFEDPAAYVVDIARRTASNRSSMLQDLEGGRETEVEAINGAVVAAADRAGLQAPWNINMLQMIKAAEKSGQ
jgi:2-dehydropantoate 2-reductase